MNGGNQSWQQGFTYADQNGQNGRYGNRHIDATNTTPGLVTENPRFDPATNRIQPQAGEQYFYDSAGNLTKNQTGHTFAYDAENRQTIYDGGNPVTGGTTYAYDGDGRRVKKLSGSGTTIFVYNALGQLVAEYTDPQPTGYGTSYLTADSLGTPRVITSSNGSVIGRHDYLPFGEEIAASYGGRSGVTGYPATDKVRQQFTQKERDVETGLDYFGARYYGSTMGRFTSPDPLLSSGRPIHPQSWNQYSYVINQPLSLIDPNGLDWGFANWTDDQGVRHTDYHYFTGDVGDWSGHSYTAVNFGGDATRTLDLFDGRTVAISNNPDALNGAYMRDVTAHSQAEQEPVLPPSWLDYVPIASTGRKFLFHYTTHNFEAALLDFGTASAELGTLNVGASAATAKAFATESGEAIFYSGGKAAFQAATEAATAEGGRTISMTVGGRALEKLTAPLPERLSTSVWNWGSKHFAEGAWGNVRVFLREPIRNNSTWNAVEYPILRVNPFVRTVPR
jgi:RHS repeat-associated protein